MSDLGLHVTSLFPGYIKTNLSKNALSSGKGEKFGKVDPSIG